VSLTTHQMAPPHVCCFHQLCVGSLRLIFGRVWAQSLLPSSRVCLPHAPDDLGPNATFSHTNSSLAAHLLLSARYSLPWTTTRKPMHGNGTSTTKTNTQRIKNRMKARPKHRTPQDVASTSRNNRTRHPIPPGDQFNSNSNSTRYSVPREKWSSRNSNTPVEVAQLQESAAQQLTLRLHGWSLRA
jgi:hypothetical protein